MEKFSLVFGPNFTSTEFFFFCWCPFGTVIRQRRTQESFYPSLPRKKLEIGSHHFCCERYFVWSSSWRGLAFTFHFRSNSCQRNFRAFGWRNGKKREVSFIKIRCAMYATIITCAKWKHHNLVLWFSLKSHFERNSKTITF